MDQLSGGCHALGANPLLAMQAYSPYTDPNLTGTSRSVKDVMAQTQGIMNKASAMAAETQSASSKADLMKKLQALDSQTPQMPQTIANSLLGATGSANSSANLSGKPSANTVLKQLIEGLKQKLLSKQSASPTGQPGSVDPTQRKQSSGDPSLSSLLSALSASDSSSPDETDPASANAA